jgi:hypothetical protein
MTMMTTITTTIMTVMTCMLIFTNYNFCVPENCIQRHLDLQRAIDLFLSEDDETRRMSAAQAAADHAAFSARVAASAAPGECVESSPSASVAEGLCSKFFSCHRERNVVSLVPQKHCHPTTPRLLHQRAASTLMFLLMTAWFGSGSKTIRPGPRINRSNLIHISPIFFCCVICC